MHSAQRQLTPKRPLKPRKMRTSKLIAPRPVAALTGSDTVCFAAIGMESTKLSEEAKRTKRKRQLALPKRRRTPERQRFSVPLS